MPSLKRNVILVSACSHAETIPQRKVSAWLCVWYKKGCLSGGKRLHKSHNETIPTYRCAEKPCATSIFAKRKRLIVSIPVVSKLSTLFDQRDGNSTVSGEQTAEPTSACLQASPAAAGESRSAGGGR